MSSICNRHINICTCTSSAACRVTSKSSRQHGRSAEDMALTATSGLAAGKARNERPPHLTGCTTRAIERRTSASPFDIPATAAH